jgi:hypothetical protein
MYGPARFATGHRRRVQRRRSRQLASSARQAPVTVAVVDPAATAAAWTSPAGLPDAGLTTRRSREGAP